MSRNVATYVYSYLARAYAEAKDEARFEQAINIAIKLIPENYGDGTGFVYHTKSGVMAEASHGYLDVGEPLKALNFRGDITRQIELDQNNRLHAWIPLDWARAHLMLGEVEESVKEATGFYTCALAMRVSPPRSIYSIVNSGTSAPQRKRSTSQ